MTKQHPITPPLELVRQWYQESDRQLAPYYVYVAHRAAQWGYQQAAERFPHIANQELEACCNWLGPLGIKGGNNLRAARRPAPKPTDEEIMEMMPQQMCDDLTTVSRLAAYGSGLDNGPGLFRVSLNTGLLDFARAVLARWGQP